MRRLWTALPGPRPVKALEALIVLLLALLALFVLFEWAGGLLDSGGAVGV